MLVEAMVMKIANTWFTENGIRKKLTFERDNCKTAIDFHMVQKSEKVNGHRSECDEGDHHSNHTPT